MRVRNFPARLLPVAAVMILILTACGGDEATPAGIETEQSTSTTPPVTLPATPVPTKAVLAESPPTPSVIPTVVPTVIPTVIPTLAPPRPAATLTVPTVPTATPEPEAPAGPTPVPQSAALDLDMTFPPEDMIVDSETITVTGIASPDATVSVNGNLAIPDADGRFSLELIISPAENPLAIEVIATSVAGEELSLVRTVIFVP